MLVCEENDKKKDSRSISECSQCDVSTPAPRYLKFKYITIHTPTRIFTYCIIIAIHIPVYIFILVLKKNHHASMKMMSDCLNMFVRD